MLSGLLLVLAYRTYTRDHGAKAVRTKLLAAIILGSVFVIVQDTEWLRLLRFGLTMKSGAYGSFFYLIIGSYALHAVAALAVLATILYRFHAKTLSTSAFLTAQLFWIFVVLLWPVLYSIVYLG